MNTRAMAYYTISQWVRKSKHNPDGYVVTWTVIGPVDLDLPALQSTFREVAPKPHGFYQFLDWLRDTQGATVINHGGDFDWQSGTFKRAEDWIVAPDDVLDTICPKCGAEYHLWRQYLPKTPRHLCHQCGEIWDIAVDKDSLENQRVGE